MSAMRAAGYDVKVLAEVYGRGAKDRDWLPDATARGWVLISKDDRWRYRREEKEILIRASARAFIFASKAATSQQIAEAVLAALPEMANLLAAEPAAVIGRIRLHGSIVLLYSASQHLPEAEGAENGP